MTRRLHLVTHGMAGAAHDYLVTLSVLVCAPSSHEAAGLVESVFIETEFAKGAPRMWFVDITVDQLVEIDVEHPTPVKHELSQDMARLFDAYMAELEASYPPPGASADCDDHSDDP